MNRIFSNRIPRCTPAGESQPLGGPREPSSIAPLKLWIYLKSGRHVTARYLSPPYTLPLPALHSHFSGHFCTGPFNECRLAAVIKRQRGAGKILSGRAAKLKRRAELKARGLQDEEVLESMTSSFGQPGLPFVSSIDHQGLCELPHSLRVQVSALSQHRPGVYYS